MKKQPPTKEAFLEAFVEHLGDTDAARRAVGVSKRQFYEWLDDEEFRSTLDRYRARMAEEIEAEAFRRALSKGSDQLIAKLLQGLRRERYGDADRPPAVTVVYVSGLRSTPRPGSNTDGGPEADAGGAAGEA